MNHKKYRLAAVIVATSVIVVGVASRGHAQSFPGPAAPGVYYVDDWFEAGECGVDGAEGPYCELDSAIERIHDHCDANLPHGLYPFTSRGGCRIEFGAGLYRITSPIEVCRAHTYEGKGGNGWGPMTIIQAFETTAFVLKDPERCATSSATGGGAGWSRIQDLAIVHKGKTRVSDPAYGVEAFQTFAATRMLVWGFVHGFHIEAGGASGGNANNFEIGPSVVVNWSEHAPVWARGPDANNGAVIRADLSTGCTEASKWNEHFRLPICDNGEGGWVDSEPCQLEYRCAGVMDASFLGNRIDGVHIAGMADISVSPNVVYACGGSYQSASSGSFMAPYCESDQPPIYLGRSATGFGGTATYTGPGGWLTAFSVPGGLLTDKLVVENKLDPDNVVELQLGAAQGAAGTFFGAVARTGGKPAWPLRLKYLSAPYNWYSLDLANSNSYSAVRIGGMHSTTTPSSPLGLGGLDLGPPQAPDNVKVNGTVLEVP